MRIYATLLIILLAATVLSLGFLIGSITSGPEKSFQQQVIDACVQKGGVPLSDRYSRDAAITDCKFPNDPREDRFR